jgi:hypothetical protein
MRQRPPNLSWSLEEGRGPELREQEEPRPRDGSLSPARKRPDPKRKSSALKQYARAAAGAAAAIVAIFCFFRILASVLSTDAGSPCSTPVHTLLEAGLPRWPARVLLPAVVSVGNIRLWSPKVVSQSGQLKSTEKLPGCPRANVALRSAKIVVQARSGAWFGKFANRTFEGVTAACVQHAVDVLSGNKLCS